MNYTGLADKALKLIEEHGKPITILRPGTADGWTREYDPVQMRDKWTRPADDPKDPDVVVYDDPSETDVEDETSAVEDGYKSNEIDGTMVQTGDRRYWVPADGLTEPSTIDRLVDGTDSMVIISCKRVAPGPVVILYEVQCRG